MVNYKTYKFSFDDLSINNTDIIKYFGKIDEDSIQYFISFINIAISLIKQSEFEAKAEIWRFKSTDFQLNTDNLLLNNIEFNIGTTISKMLQKSSVISFFLCTAGSVISEISQEKTNGGDNLMAYIVDIIGNLCIEKISGHIKKDIITEIDFFEFRTTNIFSPGYCEWPIEEQSKLFTFFKNNFCEVTLTKSNLMEPLKSLSGLFGAGKEVISLRNTCKLCSKKDCNLRLVKA